MRSRYWCLVLPALVPIWLIFGRPWLVGNMGWTTAILFCCSFVFLIPCRLWWAIFNRPDNKATGSLQTKEAVYLWAMFGGFFAYGFFLSDTQDNGHSFSIFSTWFPGHRDLAFFLDLATSLTGCASVFIAYDFDKTARRQSQASEKPEIPDSQP